MEVDGQENHYIKTRNLENSSSIRTSSTRTISRISNRKITKHRIRIKINRKQELLNLLNKKENLI